MQNRRDFLKSAMLLSGMAGCAGVLPESILKASAIDPAPGSTFEDAEHVVILMQENRSFDHCYGSLQGVRGFNDPRATRQPNGNPVWMQSYANGETYLPFHLDIKDTRATWTGYLPHTRKSQVDAWNGGAQNQWLEAKRSTNAEYAELPLTMGHYTRDDIPFYYAMADAFTVCDQHFCSALTCTYPNRLMFWTGSLREKQSADSKANLKNGDLSYGSARWTTFPERLQSAGVSWKFYQNALSATGGLTAAEHKWLGNFGCNPLEFFAQYGVTLAGRRTGPVEEQIQAVQVEVANFDRRLREEKLSAGDRKQLELGRQSEADELARLQKLQQAGATTAPDMPAAQRAIHDRAFTTNVGDPAYRSLASLKYDESGKEVALAVPAGDVLHQFREDVQNGKLPMVSWLAAPELFSAHPAAPWYGAWYVSEILNILTKNPEVWKKTIFILTYDENDGYFDHVAPFVSPDPKKPATGACTPGIDTTVEYVHYDDDLRWDVKNSDNACGGPIGLGFRVPMVVASPWTRGGWVNSQVFDHTSTLQFLEKFLSRKTGKRIEETNISEWRRAVTGNLTSIFRPYDGSKLPAIPFVDRDQWVETIHKARSKAVPAGFRKLTLADFERWSASHAVPEMAAMQEQGIRPSSALPYELYVDGMFKSDRGTLELHMRSGNEAFGPDSAGAAFNVYATSIDPSGKVTVRPAGTYTVAAGRSLAATLEADHHSRKAYDVSVHGPNGFFRQFAGNENDPLVNVSFDYDRLPSSRRPSGDVTFTILNRERTTAGIRIIDNAYSAETHVENVAAGGSTAPVFRLKGSHQWYDFTVEVDGRPGYSRRFAGRVETGKPGFSDPLMGGVAAKQNA